jgi:hypothetical protein
MKTLAILTLASGLAMMLAKADDLAIVRAIDRLTDAVRSTSGSYGAGSDLSPAQQERRQKEIRLEWEIVHANRQNCNHDDPSLSNRENYLRALESKDGSLHKGCDLEKLYKELNELRSK